LAGVISPEKLKFSILMVIVVKLCETKCGAAAGTGYSMQKKQHYQYHILFIMIAIHVLRALKY
jgi:hypothetical protein